MPLSKHALLGASSSHRWLNCTPSAVLEREFEDRETEAAAEGTAAHALSEHKLRKALKMRSRKPTSQYDSDEMDMHTDGYVEFVLEKIAEAKEHSKDPVVLIHQTYDKRGFELMRAGWRRAMRVVNEAPTVDPVVHGEWIEYEIPNIICCSVCDWGTGVDEKHFAYCPNCGAKMDGEQI